jgi:hypothetical protein
MTKNFKKIKHKLKRLSKAEETNNNLIVQKGNDFIVYSTYKINKDNEKFNIYIIDNEQFIDTLFNSSSAIAWCNAHKGNDIELANNIVSSDRAIEFLNNDIAYTKILIKLKSTPHIHQSILLARLTEYVNRQMQLKVNLHKYIQRSKQIKSEGFSNEFTTTSTTTQFNNVR